MRLTEGINEVRQKPTKYGMKTTFMCEMALFENIVDFQVRNEMNRVQACNYLIKKGFQYQEVLDELKEVREQANDKLKTLHSIHVKKTEKLLLKLSKGNKKELTRLKNIYNGIE